MPDLTITLKDVPEINRVEKIDLPHKDYAYVLFIKDYISSDICLAIKQQWDAYFDYLGSEAPKLLVLCGAVDLKRL